MKSKRSHGLLNLHTPHSYSARLQLHVNPKYDQSETVCGRLEAVQHNSLLPHHVQDEDRPQLRYVQQNAATIDMIRKDNKSRRRRSGWVE